MEDGLLLLRNLKIENANAIAGITWGFPAISNFLGFVHALSRKLPKELELELTGCGVVCHGREVQAYQPRGWGDYVFALTRNPLTKDENSPSFIEEGRMHMTVSLLVPFNGDLDELEAHGGKEEVEKLIKRLVLCQRLAGGTINSIDSVELHEPPEDFEGRRIFDRRTLRQLLPGFALVQRSEFLADHTQKCKSQSPQPEPLDAWLDFISIKFHAELPKREDDGSGTAEWHYVPKPGKGWLVPICIGYRGISDLYSPGEVERARDETTPFRFVESVYSVGEWLSPHRVTNIDQLVWRYHSEPETGWYLCKNTFNQ